MLGRHGFAQITYAVSVVVHAGEQHRARRRARSGYMEIGKTQASFGQRIEMGCIDFAAESAQIGKAPIVGHQHHKIRALDRRADRPKAWRNRARCRIERHWKRQRTEQG